MPVAPHLPSILVPISSSGSSEAEKAAKAAERRAKAAEKVAARARGRGRGRARGRRTGARGPRGSGRGRGMALGSDEEEEFSPESSESDENTDIDISVPNALPDPTPASSDEDSDFDEQVLNEDPIPSAIGHLPPMQDESDDDEDLAAEETGIVSFNGHRWESRRNLEFQVVWTDGDVTWEALSNVNDCAAMEEYLAHRDIDDPLRLSRRKFLINRALKSSNE
ncbi:hypothetical protein GGX14DRAFT_562523 [Mycena pura]|uniref:Chromo domain-containing protein n=1 Tax=Mycena pura TaxID=153505 RepID=A0AAD6VL22_9AGAR|nr:hypothetical protein GGX14DRAFT_562523 [Mycena pura]